MTADASLAGRTAIVTGGGTGIGAACAQRLASDGMDVTICGRTESKLTDVVDRIGASGAAGTVRHQVTDVTVEDDVAALVAGHMEAFGRLDGFVANAGGGGGMGPYHLQDTTEFLRVLHLNVLGTMLSVKHSVPHLVAAGGGSFVGMSSLAGHRTHPMFGAYTVAKAGIEEMMKNAADEYGEVKVRFNAVRPGFISTEIMEGIPRDSEVYDSYIQQTPLGDVGEPEDVANLVRFLVSDEARWITGMSINVDGGHHLRRGPLFTSFIEPAIGHDALVAKGPVPS
ncbi:glucose 1-dehydrogenase [Rhabdothermincola salaria]|uniref:glucose 1-dehydrogenase n=1 Tax=Rhabdothermincola salaria TaxID=2903142 RepID=UPI001E581A37|nr:glucose 1-dehydrogenase [Rhabdothermincola salaria]MCD9623653.1 glucose 1-dehydrogenase [Rhabdothermincola salaria]